MKAISLMFHDAIKGIDFNETGFPSRGASIYKLNASEMEEHFKIIKTVRQDGPIVIDNYFQDSLKKEFPLYLTFDDGGVSAATIISSLLNDLGWHGHFFITAKYIGSKTFINKYQIQELRNKGHIIGSHSWSHPDNMLLLSHEEVKDEWIRSINVLSEIIGEQVRVASVPSGYFSKRIAKIASSCGIRVLFTSEPQKSGFYVDECLVLGRYTIKRGMSPSDSKDLISQKITNKQIVQFLSWNVKKYLKTLLGSKYFELRNQLLKNQQDQ